MPLVMRLETAAAKCDRLVKPTEKFDYDFDAADMRDLLREAATRIKWLEHNLDGVMNPTVSRQTM